VTPPKRALTSEEVARYHRDGFVQPVELCDQSQIAALRQAVDEHIAGIRPTNRYELTDPIKVGRLENPGGSATFEYLDEQPATLPFLFNVWRLDDRFATVAMDPAIAGMALQLLDCDEVLLMEDNVVAKAPGSGTIPWHQDLAYWPITEPVVVTAWIALQDVDATNGAMMVVPGSHGTVEHLPVAFGDASTFMGEHRPEVPELTQDPAAEGHPISTYDLRAGQGGFHHPLVWHGSTPNATLSTRCAYVLRYVATGTRWWGSARIPYDDIGCAAGEPVTSRHLPSVGKRS
jgi:ectoine hydroxylase-related dioxygenase (phytanoyl-CoA dioxygenase family)